MCCLITSSTVITRVLSQCIADTKDEVRDFEIITLSFRFVNGSRLQETVKLSKHFYEEYFRISRCLPCTQLKQFRK